MFDQIIEGPRTIVEEDPNPKGWVTRYETDFSEVHDFAAGGHGDTYEFDGVTWTAHINQVSGSGPSTFASGPSGLQITPTYRSYLYNNPANPQCPLLSALIADMVDGYDLSQDVCVQARLSVANLATNYEGSGLAFWEAAKSRSSRVSLDYRNALKAIASREASATANNEVVVSPQPDFLELIIRRGLVVEARYGTWAGSWPDPETETQPSLWSWAADSGATAPGDTSKRPFTAAGLRVAVYAGDDSGAGGPIDTVCPALRVLELVGS